MRKMTFDRVFCFSLLMTIWIGLSVFLTWLAVAHLPITSLFTTVSIFGACWTLGGTVLYRLLMHFFPLRTGRIELGSSQEFVYQVFYNSFNFFLFFPLAFSGLIPVPLSRLFYKIFGAQIEEDTYPGRCMIFDPRFVSLGKMVVMGFNASLVPHIMEGERLAHVPIRVGDHATIGVNAVVLAGVTVGKRAVIAAGAVVPKFTTIGPGEIWAGIPARRIGLVRGDPGGQVVPDGPPHLRNDVVATDFQQAI